jgi:hypothetical protein
VTWHTSAGYFSRVTARESADVVLGCNLTVPVNNSYTGTVVVSSSFPPSANALIGIRRQVTANHTSTARVAAPYLDVVSLNGVEHHMGQPSMPKVAVSLR